MTIFGCLLLVMGTGNRIWEEETLQSAVYAFAACVIFLFVAAIVARGGREPLRRGGATPDLRIRAIPSASLGAAVLGIGAGVLGAGFVFGQSIVLLGAGVLGAGILLLARELRAQHRASSITARERS